MEPLFLCLDCGLDTQAALEYYMLRDEIWLAAHPDQSGMLCIGCVELRLDRRLEPGDFALAPLNYPGLFFQSARLSERIGDGDAFERKLRAQMLAEDQESSPA